MAGRARKELCRGGGERNGVEGRSEGEEEEGQHWGVRPRAQSTESMVKVQWHLDSGNARIPGRIPLETPPWHQCSGN